MAKLKKKKKDVENVEETETAKAGGGKTKDKSSKSASVEKKKSVKSDNKKGKEAENASLTEEYIDDILEDMDNLREDLEKSISTAAAAKRARKATTELDKKFKEFRKLSVAHHKK